MSTDNLADPPGRWSHVKKLLERTGPLCHTDFQPGPEVLEFIHECKVLVVGAGGLGCELLKDLALMGFRNLHVIDMDTIDLSNLNRQFLFRTVDINKSKAQVAAEFINRRVAGCNVKAYFNKIQDFDEDFYRDFQIVVCGLDSVLARRWINSMLVSLLNYEDGMLDQASIIPMVDGGTEGFKGNARVVIPGMSACVECSLDLYPPQVNFPLCTIANIPRLPEHCIEYVRIFQWPKENPFGADVAIDGDDPEHLQWILEESQKRAKQYNISNVTYRLTQGVIKHIIPAVASTNAVIAAICATEVFKIATSCCNPLNNYMIFNDICGLYTYTFEAERRPDCLVCSQQPRTLHFSPDSTLKQVFDHLTTDIELQMKSPGMTTIINGKNRTLYMQGVKVIEEATRKNLSMTLQELGLQDGQQLLVADITYPSSMVFCLKLAPPLLQ